MADPTILSAAELAQYFPPKTPDPPTQSFELGLVLGGTVSAGAYTAGVLDYLVEALDAWYLAKAANDAAAPKHDVRLTIVTGASGGTVCGTVLSRALQFNFPPVTATTPRGVLTTNPLYDLWVMGFVIEGLMGTQDLPAPAGQALASLLDSTLVDTLAAGVAGYTGPALAAGQRLYVMNPLRLVMSLTNLRGVPYLTSLTGVPATAAPGGAGQGEYFLDHGDYARFAMAQPAGTAGTPPRPDEFAVAAATDEASAADWANIAEYAKGSAAFPGGFRARDLHRPRAHYRFRVTIQPDNQGEALVVALQPAWDRMHDPADAGADDYAFAVVDGGALDNEPIQLARTWLAGLTARNPRDATKATRAVLLVDPLASAPDLGPAKSDGMARTLWPFLNGEVTGGRYLTADMALMADDTVFSRFMITPWRMLPGQAQLQVGGGALAGSGLGAFAGFVHEDLRWHDYMLGRANCATYLRSQLLLDATNPLFAAWTPAQRASNDFCVVDATGRAFLPIIPVMPALAAVPQPMPDWPKPVISTTGLTNMIGARVAAVLQQLQTDETDLSWLESAVVGIVAKMGAEGAAEWAVAQIVAYLNSSGMAAPAAAD